MPLDQLAERSRFLHRQVVLGSASGAGEVDVLDLVGPVVLRPTLEVGMTDHADLFQHRQGPVHGGGVHRGEPAVDPPGHVLGSDVAVSLEDFLHDDLALRGHPVAPLPEHRGDGGGPVHLSRVLAGTPAPPFPDLNPVTQSP